jgi:SulP family sulfate permease
MEDQPLLPTTTDLYGTTPPITTSFFDPASPRRYQRTISQSHSIRCDAHQLSPDTIDIDTSDRRRASVAAVAAAEGILHDRERRSTLLKANVALPFDVMSSGSLSSRDSLEDHHRTEVHEEEVHVSFRASSIHKQKQSPLTKIASQVPAVTIVSVLNFMIGIPFGASYFPVEWANSGSTFSTTEDTSQQHVDGEFPLPGKEALGLRMFLFSTIMAQLAFTFTSKFTNGIGLQMVENVPFCLELARIVIREQGYGRDALSTLFTLFGIASVVVGATFYMLGRFSLGRVVYFFPSHVLVGCIGGIGAFIINTCELW